MTDKFAAIERLFACVLQGSLQRPSQQMRALAEMVSDARLELAVAREREAKFAELDQFAQDHTCTSLTETNGKLGARISALEAVLREIVAIASGEKQVAIDDTHGMAIIDAAAREALKP